MAQHEREQDAKIVEYFLGDGPDGRGRTIHEVLRLSDEEIEQSHDFIQWLFPTATPSVVDRNAPLVDESLVEAFKTNQKLKNALRRGFERMLSFYGLALDEGEHGVTIRETSKFPTAAQRWLHPDNHNHMRLSRILESLRILGLQRYALALFQKLKEIHDRYPGRVTDRTMTFWEMRAKGGEKRSEGP